MTYKITKYRDHYNVFINDKFYCSADNVREATKEVEEYMKDGVQNENKNAYQKLWGNRAL